MRVIFRGKFCLELVDRAAGFTHEPTKLVGYSSKLVGTKDDQEQESNDDQLLGADAEHGSPPSLREVRDLKDCLVGLCGPEDGAPVRELPERFAVLGSPRALVGISCRLLHTALMTSEDMLCLGTARRDRRTILWRCLLLPRLVALCGLLVVGS
jgi:hypothetical protein